MQVEYLLFSHFMSTAQGKTRKKSGPSYFTSIVSVALVLFIVGILGVFYFQSTYLINSLKESFQLQLELKENNNEADILQYRKLLEAEPYIKSVTYISKEQAAEIMKQELGDDFIELLGFNPLYASINLTLQADYANPDSLVWIKEKIMSANYVKDVVYDLSLIESIAKNSGKIALVTVGILTLFFIIAIFLIDSTIRLAMFSNRFVIRSMKLVGATNWFIIKPFILRGIFNGFVSGMLASLGLIGLLIYAETSLLLGSVFDQPQNLIYIILILLALGMFISWISTHRAVGKYLNSKLEDLY